MSAGCERCRAVGPSCGTVRTVSDKGRCLACGELTGVITACGAYRHAHYASTAHVTYVVHVQAGKGWQPRANPNYVEPAPRREFVSVAKQTRAAQVVSSPLQPMLRDELAEKLTAVELGRAVELWNGLFRGMHYQGAHRTALGILNGTLKHHAIPAVPDWDASWLAPLEQGPMWHDRYWTVPADLPAEATAGGHVLAGYDVNGMYLSAAADELGTGAPQRLAAPADGVLRVPGWVRVAVLENAPLGVQEQWREDMWMPTRVVEILRHGGAEFLLSEALIWPEHRRWLRPHVSLLSAARSALVGHPEGTAEWALARIVKGVYTRAIGGLLESDKHNAHGDSFNPAHALQVRGIAQARMFYHLLSTRNTGATLVGIHADAAHFVMPTGYDRPPRLPISERADGFKLGKFKAAGRTPWTVELAAAHAAGKIDTLRKAL